MRTHRPVASSVNTSQITSTSAILHIAAATTRQPEQPKEVTLNTHPLRGQIFALAAIMFLAMMSLTLPIAQLDHFMARFVPESQEYARTAKSFFVTAHFLAYVLLALLWGALSDHLGRRKPFIVAGLAGSAAMYLLLTTIDSLPFLYVARFVDGSFSVMAVSLLMSAALDAAGTARRGMVMGIVMLGMLLGNATGAPLGGVLAALSVLYPFYLGAFVLALAALLAALLFHEPPIPTRPDSLAEALALLRIQRSLAIPYAFSFMERLTVGFFIGVFPLLLGERFGLGPARVGMYQGAFLFTFALLSPLGGILADRLGRAVPLVVAGILYGTVLALVGVSSEAMLWLVMVAGGVLGAMLLPATVALTGDMAPVGQRGVAMGGFNVFGSIGFAVGPVVFSFVADTLGMQASSAAAGLSSLLVATLCLPFLFRRASPRNHRSPAPAQQS